MSKPARSWVIRLTEAQAAAAGERSVRVLQHGTLDVVLGTPARPDEQTMHEQDEVYIVVRGRGVLFHDGKRDACCLPGNRERLTGHQGGARLVQNAAAARTAALGEAVGDPARLVEG